MICEMRYCNNEIEPQRGAGRPKKYCCHNCKTAEFIYRLRELQQGRRVKVNKRGKLRIETGKPNSGRKK